MHEAEVWHRIRNTVNEYSICAAVTVTVDVGYASEWIGCVFFYNKNSFSLEYNTAVYSMCHNILNGTCTNIQNKLMYQMHGGPITAWVQSGRFCPLPRQRGSAALQLFISRAGPLHSFICSINCLNAQLVSSSRPASSLRCSGDAGREAAGPPARLA